MIQLYDSIFQSDDPMIQSMIQWFNIIFNDSIYDSMIQSMIQ
jgi:hypothetical protein